MVDEREDPLLARQDYGSISLEEGSLVDDPLVQLKRWVDEAAAEGIYEPNGMVVSTIDPDGNPSSRTVLLRGIDERGLYFYTDYGSRKGLALLANPAIAVVFPWYVQHRQVKIFGHAYPVEESVSDLYFESRPRGSQISAWASDQSRTIESRQALEAKVAEMEEKFTGVDALPRPDKWGGFVIEPERVEFWAGRTSRLHDRIRFQRAGDSWKIDRLQP